MPDPLATPRSVADLVAMPEARAEAFSADGAWLGYLSNLSGTHQVWLRQLPEGPDRQLTDMPERIGGFAFSPVGRDLVFFMDRGGDERHQLWLIRDGEGAPEPLTDDPATVHAWGCWSPDGERIAYASNARDRRVMDLHVMVPRTRAARRVMEGSGWCEPLAFTPDGEGLIVRGADRGMMDQDLWLLDLASGARRLLLGAGDGGEPTAILTARFLPGTRTLAVLCDRGGFHALHALDLEDGTVRPVARLDGQDIELVALAPGEPRVGLVANRDGYSRLFLHDAEGAADATPTAEIALPEPGVISSLRFLPGGGGLVMSFETARDPVAIWRCDLESGHFEPYVRPPRTVPAEALVAPELVSFTASDGLGVPAFVYRPRRPARDLPVLFIVHGGPESQWRPGFRGDLQHYLDLGFLVIAPNVRGSTGYGRAYHQLDDRERRRDAVRDLCEMAEAVAAWPEVDAARIGAMGQSYGGYMVLAALCARPDLWKTGVDLYGVADFITLMRTTGPWRRALRTPEYGDPAEMGEFLAEISPVRHLERMRAPLLLVHATEDPRVAMEQSEQVFAILRGLGHPVEFLRVEGEGHGFARRENRITVFSRIAEFLARTL